MSSSSRREVEDSAILLVWNFKRRGTVKARFAPAEKPVRAMRVVSRPRSSAWAER